MPWVSSHNQIWLGVCANNIVIFSIWFLIGLNYTINCLFHIKRERRLLSISTSGNDGCEQVHKMCCRDEKHGLFFSQTLLKWPLSYQKSNTMEIPLISNRCIKCWHKIFSALVWQPLEAPPPIAAFHGQAFSKQCLCPFKILFNNHKESW